MSDFRWFTDDKTEAVRKAKAEYREAHDNLQAHSDHHYETHPRSHYEDPEYLRLNGLANDAKNKLAEVKRGGWKIK